jgi:hypothetical protein
MKGVLLSKMFLLKPMLKISHMTLMNIKGRSIAQSIPKYDPKNL